MAYEVPPLPYDYSALEPYDFEVIYGAWWDRLVRRDAKAIVRRSAQRYSRALRGEMTP